MGGGWWQRLRGSPGLVPLVAATVMCVLAIAVVVFPPDEEDRRVRPSASSTTGSTVATTTSQPELTTTTATDPGATTATTAVPADVGAAPEPEIAVPEPAPSESQPPALTGTDVPPEALEQLCGLLRLAGRAPVHQGDDLYRPEFDPDGNGVACE